MSARADAARRALASSGALERFARFDPRPISTILVGLDVPGSDVDVACSYGDATDTFRAALDAWKTEPALCRALEIAGIDPYEDLLAVESWSDARLRDALVARVGDEPPGGDRW